ncbi:MAG: hypothetical protein JWQ90_2481 [Hydrocarboniphaga sp.]|nr:hypothetical protein [Hydrocarboniphaga sp.]
MTTSLLIALTNPVPGLIGRAMRAASQLLLSLQATRF